MFLNRKRFESMYCKSVQHTWKTLTQEKIHSPKITGQKETKLWAFRPLKYKMT